MRRNVLLSAVALMMAANVFAQEDVTPASFKFKDLPVGPVQMYWGTGANPSVAELNVAGSIVAGVAPAKKPYPLASLLLIVSLDIFYY